MRCVGVMILTTVVPPLSVGDSYSRALELYVINYPAGGGTDIYDSSNSYPMDVRRIEPLSIYTQGTIILNDTCIININSKCVAFVLEKMYFSKIRLQSHVAHHECTI